MKHLLLVVLLAGMLLPFSNATAQETEKKCNIEFSSGLDIMSRYVWRGTDFGRSPSLQPALELGFGSTKHAFTLGAWGAYTTNGANAQEADLYLGYTFNEMLSLTVTDYFFPDDNAVKQKYFMYKEARTGHIFEAALGFECQKIPLSLTAAYNFYGADADHSAYFELGYGFKHFDFFIGATPGAGIYVTEGHDGFSVVNLGITHEREIQITDKFALPVSASLIANPQAENIFFVFGISL